MQTAIKEMIFFQRCPPLLASSPGLKSLFTNIFGWMLRELFEGRFRVILSWILLPATNGFNYIVILIDCIFRDPLGSLLACKLPFSIQDTNV